MATDRRAQFHTRIVKHEMIMIFTENPNHDESEWQSVWKPGRENLDYENLWKPGRENLDYENLCGNLVVKTWIMKTCVETCVET